MSGWIDFRELKPGVAMHGRRFVIVHQSGHCLAKWNGSDFVDDRELPWSLTVRYWIALPEMPVWADSDPTGQKK